MSNNIEAEDVTQFLTDGSVWTRQKGKLKGQTVRLLMLTNVDLIGTAAADEHPVRVVYANAKNQIFDRVVDDFCDLYKFHHVDGDLETKLERLLAFEEPETEDDEDEDDEETDAPASDATTLFDTPQTKSTSSEVKASTLADDILRDLSEDTDQNGLGIKFKISEVPNFSRPLLTEDDLEAALFGYVQEPAWSHGLLNHRLIFRLGGPISLSSLREVFEPSEAVDTVTSFSGVVAGEFFDTVWTTWIGAFLESFNGEQYVAIHVGTEYAPQAQSEEEPEFVPQELPDQSNEVKTSTDGTVTDVESVEVPADPQAEAPAAPTAPSTVQPVVQLQPVALQVTAVPPAPTV